MIFYTSDWHIKHKKILRLANRPFRTLDEMHHEILRRYNAVVSDEDICYFLGDLFVAPRDGKPHGEEAFLDRLNGRKVLILGNHDDEWIKYVDLSKYFEQVSQRMDVMDSGQAVTLCHYPLADAAALRKGGFMIHGHLHNNSPQSGENWSERILNACVEVNQYAPATLDQLIYHNGMRISTKRSTQF